MAVARADQPPGLQRLRLAAHRQRLDLLGLERRRPPAGGSTSPISVSPAAAACCRRAATLTASPVTSAWPADASPATTSPLLTPVRIAIWTPHWRWSSRFRRSSSSCSSSAARTARAGVVLERVGDAEHGHHGVADELLDRAAVALDDAPRRTRSSAASRAGRPRARAVRPATSSPATSVNRIVTGLRSSEVDTLRAALRMPCRRPHRVGSAYRISRSLPRRQSM